MKKKYVWWCNQPNYSPSLLLSPSSSPEMSPGLFVYSLPGSNQPLCRCLMSTSLTAKWGWVAADNWELGMKSLISVNGLDTPDAAFLPFVHLPLSSVCVSGPHSNRPTQGIYVWCHCIVPSSCYYSFIPLPLLCSAVVIYSLMLIFTSGPSYKPSQDRDPSCIFMQIS